MTAEQDAEAYRLRKQRTGWVEIAEQIGLVRSNWMGADAVLAYARGGHETIPDDMIRKLPRWHKERAREWNATLAAENQSDAA